MDEADLDARLLLEAVCGTNRNDLLVHGDRLVTGEEWERVRELLVLRARHVPLQRILGSQNFMGLDFAVGEGVLIPRQDTEILVEEAMRRLHDGMRILDLCTGSGCILISLLHYSNDCGGVGADLSEVALEIARKNAERLLEKGRDITFVQGDLFEAVEGRFDLIVCNPPYIRSDVIPTLMPEVRDHEPLMALDGGEDGLRFYREIAARCGAFLERGGELFFEIGCDQAEAVQGLLENAGFREVEVVQDYAGLDRVVHGTYLPDRTI